MPLDFIALRLLLPYSQEAKKQLSKMEVDTSWQLSHIRIHVEQVIGLLRQKYTILEGTLPINSVMTAPGAQYSTTDKIVSVCTALCNCCDSM